MRFSFAALALILLLGTSLGWAGDSLPDGPERALIDRHCVRCHSIDWIEQTEGSELEWIMRVRRMLRRGSELPQDQVAPVAAYLARALPRRVRAEAVRASPIEIATSEVAARPIQVWIRTAGRLEKGGSSLRADVSTADARKIEIGQRVRAFPLTARSSMHQGKVVGVEVGKTGSTVRVDLRSHSGDRPEYLLEIVTDRGSFLSLPNEAIIEEAGRRVVYVQSRSSDFTPHEIVTGVEGELYTQVIRGVEAGEQVVTFGSFFIDAEYKMKGSQAESLAIAYVVNGDSLRAGENPVEVSVRSLRDEPVTDATVSVSYYMAAMPAMSMPEMRDVFTLEHRGQGKYAGNATLSMGGSWLVTVSVSKAGKIIGTKQLTLFAED